VFDSDYVREHITHGYAVTVLSVQGVTAGSAHAVLSEATTRALFYVTSHEVATPKSPTYISAPPSTNTPNSQQKQHVMKRGSSRQAGQSLHAILPNDEQPVTAHGIALATADDSLPSRVRAASGRRAADVRNRQTDYLHWRAEADTCVNTMRVSAAWVARSAMGPICSSRLR
jgi:hypothetical protein